MLLSWDLQKRLQVTLFWIKKDWRVHYFEFKKDWRVHDFELKKIVSHDKH